MGSDGTMPRTMIEGVLPADLDALAEERRREWEAMEPGEAAEAFYREKLFPAACERMRALGRRRGPFALAFVPVGTQPYSPILAALASPASATVLLHSERTVTEARLVADALAGERGSLVLRTIGSGTDVARIVRVVEGEYAAAGLPEPGAVVVDLTGGRKAMSAALASIASVRGFRQAYVEGQASAVHRGFVAGERFVELPGVHELTGAGERRTAVALLRAGAWREAARRFRELAGRSGASAADLCLAHASEGWAAWCRLEWQAAARGFGRAHRLAPGEEAAAWLQDLRHVAREAAEGMPGTRGWLAAGVALDHLDRRETTCAGAVAAAARIPARERDRKALAARARDVPGLEGVPASRLRRLVRPSRAVDELLGRLGPAVGPR